MVIVALGAHSLAYPRQSRLVEFGIRTQNLHIDNLEHKIDDLEHKFLELSRDITQWDINMLKGRLHRIEGIAIYSTGNLSFYFLFVLGLEEGSLPFLNGRLEGCSGETGSRNMAATQKSTF